MCFLFFSKKISCVFFLPREKISTKYWEKWDEKTHKKNKKNVHTKHIKNSGKRRCPTPLPARKKISPKSKSVPKNVIYGSDSGLFFILACCKKDVNIQHITTTPNRTQSAGQVWKNLVGTSDLTKLLAILLAMVPLYCMKLIFVFFNFNSFPLDKKPHEINALRWQRSNERRETRINRLRDDALNGGRWLSPRQTFYRLVLQRRDNDNYDGADPQPVAVSHLVQQPPPLSDLMQLQPPPPAPLPMQLLPPQVPYHRILVQPPLPVVERPPTLPPPMIQFINNAARNNIAEPLCFCYLHMFNESFIPVALLCCGFMCHQDCIDNWGGNCPNCRSQVNMLELRFTQGW